MKSYPLLRALALFALSILALAPVIVLFSYAFVEMGLLSCAIVSAVLSTRYYCKINGKPLANAELGAFATLGAGYCLLLQASAYFIFQASDQTLNAERLIAHGLVAYLIYLITIIFCARVSKQANQQNKPASLLPRNIIDRWIERLSKPLDTLSNDELIRKIAGSPSGGIKGFILGAAFMWLLINLFFPVSNHVSAIISMLLLSFLSLLLISVLSKRNLLLEELRKRLNSVPDSASSEPSSTQYT
ncbi:hypothetical protein HCH_01144 [Hahella chejuensis KCTC 2396]|uniref:Uncharacterized protein n=1 Tax=Hahella chejuensis (strain KCTC 2396) TaxID=349521 RepID=Q2SMV3_HAHCH|nr:hypothetical protein [Hahella chejuensis]ABC28021.1 hypothetical protein HCH_01144 [Hahella chejuensis KCTC 2396]